MCKETIVRRAKRSFCSVRTGKAGPKYALLLFFFQFTVKELWPVSYDIDCVECKVPSHHLARRGEGRPRDSRFSPDLFNLYRTASCPIAKKK